MSSYVNFEVKFVRRQTNLVVDSLILLLRRPMFELVTIDLRLFPYLFALHSFFHYDFISLYFSDKIFNETYIVYVLDYLYKV
jgi:hypothetical protein